MSPTLTTTKRERKKGDTSVKKRKKTKENRKLLTNRTNHGEEKTIHERLPWRRRSRQPESPLSLRAPPEEQLSEDVPPQNKMGGK